MFPTQRRVGSMPRSQNHADSESTAAKVVLFCFLRNRRGGSDAGRCGSRDQRQHTLVLLHRVEVEI